MGGKIRTAKAPPTLPPSNWVNVTDGTPVYGVQVTEYEPGEM